MEFTGILPGKCCNCFIPTLCFLIPAATEVCQGAGKHYVYFPERKTFDQARIACSNLGNGWTMAMPRSQAENRCVYALSKKHSDNMRNNVWLGFFRRWNNPFRAVDGKPLQETFWAHRNPRRVGLRICANMWVGAPLPEQWGDFHCTSGQAFPVMCQRGKFRIIHVVT